MATYIYIVCALFLYFHPFAMSHMAFVSSNNSIEFNPDHTQHTTIDETIVHDHTKSRFHHSMPEQFYSCSQYLLFGIRYLVTCAVDCCACDDESKLWIKKKKIYILTNRESNESPMTKPQKEMNTIWRTIQIIIVYRT